MRQHRSACAVLLLGTLLLVGAAGCGADGDDGDPPRDDGGVAPSSASAKIGPAGGTIATEAGAKIVIPEGACAEETLITITSYGDEAALPDRAGILGRFAGGIVLEPTGLTFTKPVTVTIPLSTPLSGGSAAPLFLLDHGDGADGDYPAGYAGWRQTNHAGQVAPDGRSVVAQVDHFSAYVIQMNFAGDTLDVLGDSVATLGDNGLSVDFARYQEHFERSVAKIGDLHVYDLPGKFGYDCYEVVGIDYLLYHDLGALFENPLRNFKGAEGEVALYYNAEGDRTLANGSDLAYHLFINVYIDRTPPTFGLSAKRATIKTKEQTDVVASLVCGADAMNQQDVDFSVSGLGALDRETAATNGSGEATVTFTAGETEGTAVVTGVYHAHRKDQLEPLAGQAEVRITDNEKRWSGSMTYTYTLVDGIVDVKAVYAVDFGFTLLDNDHVEGSATASQDVSAAATMQGAGIANLEAPAQLDLEVTGSVTDGNLGLTLRTADRTLFSFDLAVAGANDPYGGLSELVIYSVGDGVQVIPFAEGTHSGGYSQIGLHHHAYTVTLKRDN